MRCPACGSSRVRTDGDNIEPQCHPDHDPQQSYFYEWNECDDCEYQWRGEHVEDESPDPMTILKAAAVAVALVGLAVIGAVIFRS